MMKLHCSNGRTLEYYKIQEQETFKQVLQTEVAVTSILFDEFHREFPSQSSTTGDKTVLWEELKELLRGSFGDTSIKFEINQVSITSEMLEAHEILVLTAPTKLFSHEEVDAITQFVLDGKSLLIATDARSLYKQFEESSNRFSSDINSLLKNFGLQFKSLLTIPFEEIADFHPHFLTSQVNHLFVNEPAYLDILPGISKELPQSPCVIATLPHTHEAWLVVVEPGIVVEPGYRGRIVAVADPIIFTDEYLIDGNKQLALNIFHWLAFKNQLDCFATEIAPKVQYGETTTFSIVLNNPQDKRLEYISCLLESETGTEILDLEEKNIRSLAPYGEARICWTVKPTRIGLQRLKLTIDCLKEEGFVPLFFDIAAQFQCIPDVEFDLIVLNHQGELSDITETGKPFKVKVGLRPKNSLPTPAIKFNLTSPSSELVVESLDHGNDQYWRLMADAAGDYPVTLVIDGTGQQVSRLLRVQSSIQDQIANLEQDIITPLNQEIHRQVKKLQCGLDVEEIQHVPFHLYTPEEYTRLIHSSNSKILDVIRAARKETQKNERLVNTLLTYVSPLYSPIHGCCIPYDPNLATHLVEKHPHYQEYLAENFLCLDETNQTYLEQNIAALMLHEKYGHGFFFTQTTLGKQFSILFRHGLHPEANSDQMKSPYPRLLFEEYKPAIQQIWNSAVILDEGFATWVELTLLPKLPGTIGQGAFRRKVFLFSDAHGRYKKGYEYFQSIQEAFGTKVVMETMIAAADIDLGITEEGGKVKFTLNANTLMRAVQSSSKERISADVRLEQIYETLHKSLQKGQFRQMDVKCRGAEERHSDILIRTLIRDSIGY
jgi:hypothetical protein